VAYFFGRELYEKLQVPVGLVVSAVAGASGEAFVPEKVLTEDAVLKREYWDPYKSFVVSQSRVDSMGFFDKVTKPTLIYNGMIHLLEKLSVRGIIWYQGESNYADKGNYTRLFTALIKYWRQAFNQGTLPFYFTQIAPYTKNADKNPIILPLFWDAQQNSLKLKGTGMALTVDVGDTADVHPRNKKPVGERLAKIALNKTYGFKDILYRGPVYKDFTVDGHTVKINYIRQTTGTGLATNDGMPPRYFMIAGKDHVFHEAKAEIVGDQVWVHSDEVAQPVAVRYSFNNAVVTNLENKEGLPAMPFRTDNWDK
jgi:sialate O-acetylesterase